MSNDRALAGVSTLLDAATWSAESTSLQRARRAVAALFVTVLTIAAAQISVPLPFTPVPLTLQPTIVLLGGAVLGARLGATSQLLYLFLGIAGLPVFAASPALPAGAARLIGPTGGYLISYPLAAFIVGALAQRGCDRRLLTSALAMVAGLAVIFAGGLAWLAIVLRPHGMASALSAGLFPFVAADVVKVVIASAALPAMWRLTGLRPSRTPAGTETAAPPRVS